MSSAAPRPRLVADIGGTNARFALQRPGARPDPPVVLRCAAFADLESAVRAALAHAEPHAPPRDAAFAVAAPVLGDDVVMTNHPWRFSRPALAEALGLARLVVINDFTAVAWALPHLATDEKRKLGGGKAAHGGALAVLGPGTGLGVSGLVPADGGWTALAGEGGHVDFAPGDAREAAILERLRRRFGRVSLERVLSGPGLENIYGALVEIAGAAQDDESPSAAEIGERARAGGCPLARQTVEIFSAILGGAAGNLALTLGARGGVFVAGGIVPRLGSAFAVDAFRRRFEAKGRFADYLAAIPTWLVTAPHPALLGLARLLDGPAARQG
ncbi:MAG: glucokinase [Alphaproteobacteria bacterium]